eukprot:CAMPEP_0119021950 /NCGR_PEP_ID=MMETSP1176-20130426/27040_1 /TAXON_ID=265551 /ORGANISM="Synedropsis recta cf, Strain CCMP1620" /LENGTH=156 /DNA_ID=CAMNT_0006976671 /DNA_START=114 /DNA_END=582 /DNA_ORIENTATION=-
MFDNVFLCLKHFAFGDDISQVKERQLNERMVVMKEDIGNNRLFVSLSSGYIVSKERDDSWDGWMERQGSAATHALHDFMHLRCVGLIAKKERRTTIGGSIGSTDEERYVGSSKQTVGREEALKRSLRFWTSLSLEFWVSLENIMMLQLASFSGKAM